jgi:Mrp family chromosome partitioning ATPase
MITEHRLILSDLLAPQPTQPSQLDRANAAERRATVVPITRKLPEVALEEELQTAAQRWREQLGRDEPLPEPGTAARRWRERLAERDARLAQQAAARRRPPWRNWKPWFSQASPATPETERRRVEANPRPPASRRMPPELEGETSVMESCRLLRLNLPCAAGSTRRIAPLVMISPSPERRCALVAAGVALALADEGCRTLLVDADLRAPGLHTLFDLEPRPGLAEILAAGTAASLPVVPLAERLWLLPAGCARPMPALHRMPSLAGISGALAQQFDTVIYHIAGLHRPAEALQLSIQVGAALFTVRAGVDTAEPVRRMRATLERAGVGVLGFALVGGEA